MQVDPLKTGACALEPRGATHVTIAVGRVQSEKDPPAAAGDGAPFRAFPRLPLCSPPLWPAFNGLEAFLDCSTWRLVLEDSHGDLTLATKVSQPW
jgi:hypothetical protein